MNQAIRNFANEHSETAGNIYKGVVLAAIAIGSVKGLIKWLDWRITRKYRKINYTAIEPVVNIAVDVGTLAYHITVAGAASGVVAATCPISVPILLATCEEPPADKDTKATGVVVA